MSPAKTSSSAPSLALRGARLLPVRALGRDTVFEDLDRSKGARFRRVLFLIIDAWIRSNGDETRKGGPFFVSCMPFFTEGQDAGPSGPHPTARVSPHAFTRRRKTRFERRLPLGPNSRHPSFSWFPPFPSLVAFASAIGPRDTCSRGNDGEWHVSRRAYPLRRVLQASGRKSIFQVVRLARSAARTPCARGVRSSNGLPLTSLSSSELECRIPLMRRCAFRSIRTPARAFARTRTRTCRPGAFSPREGKDCGADRGRLHPTAYCRFEYLAGFSRHSSRVFSCEAFPRFPRCVRPLAGGHDNVKSERLAEKNVRQKYVRGLCNSNGECGHSLELPDLSSACRDRRPGTSTNHTFRKVFPVIPPPRAARTSSHRQPTVRLPSFRPPNEFLLPESTRPMRFHTVVVGRRPFE